MTDSRDFAECPRLQRGGECCRGWYGRRSSVPVNTTTLRPQGTLKTSSTLGFDLGVSNFEDLKNLSVCPAFFHFLACMGEAAFCSEEGIRMYVVIQLCSGCCESIGRRSTF